MRISAAGNKRAPTLPHCVWSLPPKRGLTGCAAFRLGAARRRNQAPTLVRGIVRGFTLLELLVVISLMALATAGISLSLRDSGAQQLEREAQRLATLLESARAQARTNGSLVVWQPLAQGFRFEGLPAQVRMPTQWLHEPVLVQPRTPVILGPEPLIPPQAIVLSLPQSSLPPLRVATDGLQPFSVQNAP